MNKLREKCLEHHVPYWLILVIVSGTIVYLIVTSVLSIFGFDNIQWLKNIFIGSGAVFGLWLAYKRSDALQKQAQADSQQAKTAEKRYASGQFSNGVELLAKDNQKGNPAIGARIGGIYALEKLAGADPEQYGAPVMKTLVAYIRDNAQRTALPVAARENSEEKTTDPEKRKEAAHLGEDIKTAFAALKRLHDDQQVLKESGINQQELSFAHTDFRALCLNEIEWIKNSDLSSANLTKTNLKNAQLNGANLWNAQLYGADLRDAQLHGATLIGAQLHGADLRDAQLNGADLGSAQLHGAYLIKAHLNGADLMFAQLHGTNLRDAQLHGANLMFAQLHGAYLEGAQAQYTSFEEVDFERLADDDLKKLESALEGLPLSDQKRSYIVDQAGQDAQVNAKNWKVWHTSKFLDKRKIKRLSKDVEWGLEWWAEIKKGDAQIATLKGLLRNFAEKDDTDASPRTPQRRLRAKQCRLAVKQLLQEDEDLRNQFIADNQGKEWWEWLSKLNDR